MKNNRKNQEKYSEELGKILQKIRKNTLENLVKELGKILRIRKNTRKNQEKYSEKLGKILQKIRKNTLENQEKYSPKSGSHSQNHFFQLCSEGAYFDVLSPHSELYTQVCVHDKKGTCASTRFCVLLSAHGAMYMCHCDVHLHALCEFGNSLIDGSQHSLP